MKIAVSSIAILTLLFCASLGTSSYAQSDSAGPSAAASGAMTPEERALLLDQLTKTKQAFIDSISGVNDAQWRFKPGPFKWSVAQVSEHIILSEDLLFGLSQQVLKSPEAPRQSNSAEQDRGLLAMVGDRTHKFFNPDALAPKGRYNSPAEAIADFTKRRDKTIEYVKTTNDPLRSHLATALGGKTDGYQLLLLMAAHTGRHTAQIKEVEANPHYPAH